MLRRLKMRSRLMVVITVPLALLLVVVVPQVDARMDRASNADDAVELAEAAGTLAEVVDAIQRERVLSAARRAGAGATVAQPLVDQRAATDAAVQRAFTALLELTERFPSIGAIGAAASKGLGTMERVRAETDLAQSIVPWVDPFAPIVGSLLELLEAVGSVVDDSGAGGGLAQAALVARTKDAASTQAAQLAAASVWGELRGDQAGILAGLRGDEAAYRTAYLAATPATVRVDRRAEVQQPEIATAGRVVDEVLADGDVTSTGGLLPWLDLGMRRQAALRDVEARRTTEALDSATALGATSRRASTSYAALAGGGLLVALVLALLAARSITRPLRRLTDAADDLAERRLPRLVDALRNPVDDDERYLAATVEPIPVGSEDELAHLARAFNAVQSVAVDVAAQQADLLRKGISDLYVNLARRNQALIERQIELLDQLEAGEEDPDVLEHLFQLDHLATRMRRNAESLLVLAGAESGPRRSRPIDVVDVVRAALSEVEAYRRVELGDLAPATVQGSVVSDVAHLLAELLDNATSFSPPTTVVRVDGARAGGSYRLTITDEGVGLTTEQLVELNTVLHDPPVTGLALGRSLGCLVAARLAARHGVTVRLRGGSSGGVVATVAVPRDALVDEPDGAWELDRSPRPLEALEECTAVDAAPPVPVPVPVPRPARLVDAVPSGAAFEAGLGSLLDAQAPVALVEPEILEHDGGAAAVTAARPAGHGARHAEAQPAVAGETPSDLEVARAPLVRRVPGAHAATLASQQTAEGGRRSPEEVRETLLRYRSGLRAGRSAAPEGQEAP